MLWPDDNRVRYAAIRERMTSEEGKRMRCIRGAKAAHAKIRAEGRTPGTEGRAAALANEKRRKLEHLQLSGATEEANRMILEAAADAERARVERLAAEWQAKQKRLWAEPGKG